MLHLFLPVEQQIMACHSLLALRRRRIGDDAQSRTKRCNLGLVRGRARLFVNICFFLGTRRRLAASCTSSAISCSINSRPLTSISSVMRFVSKYLARSWLQRGEFYRVFRVPNSKHLPQYFIGSEDSQTLKISITSQTRLHPFRIPPII